MAHHFPDNPQLRIHMGVARSWLGATHYLSPLGRRCMCTTYTYIIIHGIYYICTFQDVARYMGTATQLEDGTDGYYYTTLLVITARKTLFRTSDSILAAVQAWHSIDMDSDSGR